MFDQYLEQNFTVGRNGKTLFHPWGPSLRPFQVEDESTRDKIKSRMAWLNLSYLGLIVANLIALKMEGNFENVWWVLGSMGGLLVVYSALLGTVLRREFSKLHRVEKRMSIAELAFQFGQKETPGTAAFKLASCLGFVVLFAVSIATGWIPAAVSAIGIAIFGYMSVFWMVVMRSSN